MQEKEWNLAAQMSNIVSDVYLGIRQKDLTYPFPNESSTIDNFASVIAKANELGLRPSVEHLNNQFNQANAEWSSVDASVSSHRQLIKALEDESTSRLERLD